jgi:hypothetical protein
MAIPTLLDTPPPPPSQTAVALFSKALPVFALLAVYVAATYASILKVTRKPLNSPIKPYGRP